MKPVIPSWQRLLLIGLVAQGACRRGKDGLVDDTSSANAPPVANEAVVSTAEDTTVAVRLTGSDPDGDALVFRVVDAPTQGTLDGVPPDVSYTPNPDYNGPDSFTFVADDGTVQSLLAQVDLDVQPVNDAPQVSSVSVSTREGAPVEISLVGTDIDSPSLEIRVVASPRSGRLTGTPPVLVYTPDAGFAGEDSFTYEADDGLLSSPEGRVTITVEDVNDAPLAVEDAFVTDEDQPLVVDAPGLLVNDSDPDGDTLSAELVSPPGNGAVVVEPDGAFTYTPAPDFAGNDSFEYRVSDGPTFSAPVLVRIEVEPANDSPVGSPDVYGLAEDGVLVVAAPDGVLANDVDADGDPLSAILSVGPARGVLDFAGDGSFTYTPNPDQNGVDSFTYSVTDGVRLSPAILVTLEIAPSNDPPVTAPDAYVTSEDRALVVGTGGGLLANDSDIDRDVLTAELIDPPEHGSVSVLSGGGFTYTPDRDYNGSDAFTYGARDPGGLSAPTSVTLRIDAVNDAPVAVDDAFDAIEDQILVIDASRSVRLNDFDVDGDPLVVVPNDPPARGALTLNPDGSFTYVPDLNFEGEDQFTYQVSDGSLSSTPATVVLTVNPSNDRPVAAEDRYVTDEDVVLDLPAPGVLANDTDNDLDPLTASVITPPPRGTLTLRSDGGLRYVPALNDNGFVEFTYRASDGIDASDPVTVRVDLNPVNDAPVALADGYRTPEDTVLAVTPDLGVLANDSDVDLNPLSAVLISAPAHGALTLQADGSFVYSPSPEYVGPDAFSYQASDGLARSTTVSVNLTVEAVNDPPVGVADRYTTGEDELLDVDRFRGVLANDFDLDGDLLTASVVDLPARGELVLAADGSFTYTPDVDYAGLDRFTYVTSDGRVSTPPVEVLLEVGLDNDPPVATADGYLLDEDAVLVIDAVAGVLANDTDTEGDPLSAVLVSTTANGRLLLAGNGSFTYTPNPNFHGVDSFRYVAFDLRDSSAPVTVSLTVRPLNDLPVATVDAYALVEDVPASIPAPFGVLANDTDIDGDPLSAVLSSAPSFGDLVLRPDGSFDYTPDLNFVGADSFTYQAADAVGRSLVARVDLTVEPRNDAPVASDDAYATDEDETLVVSRPGVLANDTDVDGDGLDALLVASPRNGSLVLALDGSFLYTPNADYFGPDSFTYRASDGLLTSGTRLVSLDVRRLNDAPLALADSLLVLEDEVLTLAAPGVLANDFDADADALTASVVSPPAHGVLTLSPSGAVNYEPDPDFFGVDSFTYRVSDGSLFSAPVAVSLQVDGVPDAPVGVADAYLVVEDTPRVASVVEGVLANDSDADGERLQAVLVTPPVSGALVLEADGAFTYTPDLDFVGDDEFFYRASDGVLASDLVRVALTVSARNDPPLPLADAFVTAEDTLLAVVAPGVLSNDVDPDGDPMTAVLVSPPARGSLILDPDGGFDYAPDPDFFGRDTFSYRASDGLALSPVVVVELTVDPVNDAPVALVDGYATDEDVVLDVAAPGVLVNDVDVEGDPLTALLVTPPAGGLVFRPDGSFQYTPPLDFNGVDAFTYQADDGRGRSAVTRVEIAVGSINDPPVALADGPFEVDEDGSLVVAAFEGVLSNDSDADFDALTASLVATVSHGTLVLAGDGGFSYTPAPDYFGSDSFTYQAYDGRSRSAVTRVELTVRSVDDPPVVVADAYATSEDLALVVSDPAAGVLANDRDPEGLALTAVVVDSVDHGTLALSANGTFTYTPELNFAGVDRFTYEARAGGAGTVGEVLLTVGSVNDAPVALVDAYATDEDVALVVPSPLGVLANDSDVDGDPLTALLVTGPTRGVLTLNPSGSFTYTPNAQAFGADSFTYRASDGLASSGEILVSLTVRTVNDLPVGVADAYATDEDVPLVVSAPVGVLSNDTDIEGDVLRAALIDDVDFGTLALSSDGSFVYTPDLDFAGTDSFRYRPQDAGDGSEARVLITVGDVNDAPVAVADAYRTSEDVPLVVGRLVGVLANDTDVEGDALSASLVTGPTQGTLGLLPDGGFTYTPNAEFSGVDSFTYRASDTSGASAVALVSLSVDAVNDAPVANDDAYVTPEDVPLVVAAPGVLSNDTDLDGPLLRAVLVEAPVFGTATLDANGRLVYTPDPDFSGVDQLRYRADDSLTLSARVATITISVTGDSDPPVGVADSFAVDEDAVLRLTAPGVLANDSDPEGDPITAVLADTVDHGTLVLSPSGGFDYTPEPNYNGPDQFTYVVSDGGGVSLPVVVLLNVRPVNDLPVALADVYDAVQDVTLEISRLSGVLANDSDLDGDVLSTVLVTGPAHGLLVLNADGSFSYTPDFGFSGEDGFTYQASDGLGTSAVASVDLSVGAVNRRPEGVADVYAVDEDQVLAVAAPGVLVNDTDPDGDAITAALEVAPEHGSLVLNEDGSFTYTPDPDYFGPDSFRYFPLDAALRRGGSTLVSLTVNAVPDAPVSLVDAYATSEDTLLVVDAPGVLSNDSDIDGEALTAVVVTGPAFGALTLNADGSFTYLPEADANGDDAFEYQPRDPTGRLGPVTEVTLTVTPVQDVPRGVTDNFIVTEDILNVVVAPGVLANDREVDGEVMTASLVTGASHGVVLLSSNGSFTYEGDDNYFGPDSFTYRPNDPFAGGSVVTVNLTVTNTADAPVAVADVGSTSEDVDLVVAAPGVLANDSDVDGDLLTAVLVTPPAHGSVTLNPNGSYTYDPNLNYNGPDSFTYRASDGALTSAAVTVSLTVGAVNDAPVAVADAGVVAEDDTLVVAAPGVLANDSDVDLNPLTAVLVTGASHGAVTLNPNGSYTYVPAAHYHGPDSFTYRANDGLLNSNTVVVSLTVTAVPDAPVAVADNGVTPEDTALVVAAPGVLSNDTDADGDGLTAVLVVGPSRGSVVLNPNGSYTYTPNLNANGPDSFTYQASDGARLSAVTTVSLSVTALNDAPVAVNDAGVTNEDTPLVVAAPGVLSNDSDIDGDALTAVVVASPTNGSLTLNANGSYTYTPNANYNGADSFTYRASDGALTSAVRTVNLTVNPINDAPVGVADSYGTSEDTPLVVAAPGVLDNDADVDGDALTAALVDGPDHGTLALNANGSFTYTPDLDYVGADAFTYRGSDGLLSSAVTTVTLSVGSINDPPVAVADVGVTNEDTALVVAAPGVLGNDSDPEVDALTAVLVANPAHGAVTLNPNGSYTYTPALNYNGPDSFTYRASDGSLTSAVTTVSLTVNPVNDAPVAVADVGSTAEDTALVVAAPGVLANDSDVEGSPLTAVLVTTTSNGLLAFNANGSYTYTPNANYNGPDSFTYRANDGALNSSIVTVSLTVSAVNDAPVAVADVGVTNEDTALVVAAPGVLGNDSDIEGSPLTAVVVATPSNGTLSLNANGSYTYTPNPNYNGPDSFTYRASDGALTSAVTTVTLTVNPVNDAPVAVVDVGATNEDSALVVAAPGVLGNDSDIEGSPLTAVVVATPSNGTLSLNANGSYTYTPNLNYNGPDSFTYRASDGALTSAVTTVTLTVNPVNDAPVAVADVGVTNEDTELVVAAPGVLANDSDVDGDLLTASVVTGPEHGELTLSANGSYSYLPDVGYSGPDSFTYRASDGALNSAVTTVSLTVNAVAGPPEASDDVAWTAGNTELSVGAPGVLANDTHPDLLPVTVSSLTVLTTSLGGEILFDTDGSYLYVPPLGIGPNLDTVVYEVTDGTLTDTATLRITLGQRVWYVDNTAAPGGDGSSSAPFDTLAEAVAAADGLDVFRIYEGDATSNGLDDGITLLDGQKILGEAVDLIVDGHFVEAAGSGIPELSTGSGAVVTVPSSGQAEVAGVFLVGGSAGVFGSGTAEVTLTDLFVAESTVGVDLTGGLLFADRLLIDGTGFSMTHGVRLDGTELYSTEITVDQADVVGIEITDPPVFSLESPTVEDSVDGVYILELSGTGHQVLNGSLTGLTGSHGLRIDLAAGTTGLVVSTTTIQGDLDAAVQVLADTTGAAGAVDLDQLDVDLVGPVGLEVDWTSTNVDVSLTSSNLDGMVTGVSVTASGTANGRLSVVNNNFGATSSPVDGVVGSALGNADLLCQLVSNTFLVTQDILAVDAAASAQVDVYAELNFDDGAGSYVLDGSSGSVRAALYDNAAASFELDATGSLALEGSLSIPGAGSDGGNLAGNGNTTGGGAPNVSVVGTPVLLTPGTIPAP